MRWFTSDWHLGHSNILNYCARPFPNVTTMADTILGNVLRDVAVDDELWILGDVVMGDVTANLALLRTLLPRRIVIVGGNHDRFHPACTRGGATQQRWREQYRDASGVSELLVDNTTVTIDGQHITVSHFPYLGTDRRPGVRRDGTSVEDRFGAYRPVDDGGWLLCGHVHEKWRQSGRMINVGVDAWAGNLVSEHTIAEIIAAGPTDREPVEWADGTATS